MATIVTRAGKGTALTHNEVDANFTNLNTDKIETSEVGVSVQAHSANLDEYSTVNPTVAGLALLDDADATAQRATLGLGTAAITASTDYATSAQGALADSSLQSSAIGTSVQAYDSNLSSFVTAFTLPTTDGTTGQSIVTNGSGTLSFSSAGAGSVTSVSVVSANGLAGTVATATTTPAITLSTSVTGLLKGNGTAISAASAGTDYLAPSAIGTTVQGYDAQLADVAGLTATDNGVIIGNGTNFVIESGATLKTSLGLTIGTDVQAYNANLTSYATTAPTAAGLALLDDANNTAQRTTLGLGTLATLSTINDANWSGTDLSVPNGGTGASTLTGLIKGNGTSAFTAATVRTDYAEPTTTLTTGLLKNTTTTGAHTIAVAGTDYLAPAAIGVTVQAYDAQLADVAGLTPTDNGVVIGNGTNFVVESGATLKTSLGLTIGTDVQAYDATIVKTGVANTFTATNTFKGVVDTVFTITDAVAFEINPANGSIQTITLGANRTPAATNFVAGQCVLLGIDDGTAFTITWTTVAVTWVKAGGTASAPTLATTGYTWVLLWKVGSIIYGVEVGKP